MPSFQYVSTMEIGFPKFAPIRTYVVIGMRKISKKASMRAASEPTAGSLDGFFANAQPARMVVARITEHGQQFE
jgi:hypothetical protein